MKPWQRFNWLGVTDDDGPEFNFDGANVTHSLGMTTSKAKEEFESSKEDCVRADATELVKGQVQHVASQRRFPHKMLWDCSLARDRTTLRVSANYVGGCSSQGDVEGWIQELLEIAEWLCDDVNWDKKIGQYQKHKPAYM